MKKAILTFGLFSLVVLTSFTTTETQTQNMVAETGDTGGDKQIGGGSYGSGGSNKKLDYAIGNKEQVSSSTLNYSNDSSFNVEVKKKSDI